MCDFNEISSSNDKLGRASFNFVRLHRINDVLQRLNCIELPSSSNKFPWRNKKCWVDNIFKRIDKAIVSLSWLSCYPSASLVNHVFTSSDHCRDMLNLDIIAHVKTSPFLF